ncbi:MAG: secondary thiamine-phosphate synthase enzyme YjbQ [Thermodesulfovibrionales bacterium]|nr:secondary thiamine-phosphate synthase enzyme YjbQ [Thermodesulfovibrionales bacterium]
MVRYINVKSRHRNEFIDITEDVANAAKEAGVKSGICYIYVPHTTAAITINEGADPSVQRDIQQALTRLIPHEYNYSHREGNADAHIKSTLVGVSHYVLVDEGKLVLGTWQSIYFCEFDGPRHRRVAMKFIASEKCIEPRK